MVHYYRNVWSFIIKRMVIGIRSTVLYSDSFPGYGVLEDAGAYPSVATNFHTDIDTCTSYINFHLWRSWILNVYTLVL